MSVIVPRAPLRLVVARLLAPLLLLVGSLALVLIVRDSVRPDPIISVVVVTTTAQPLTLPASEGVKVAEERFYTIRRGDTLEAIAGELGTTVDDLYRLNPEIDPLSLAPGEKIRVS